MLLQCECQSSPMEEGSTTRVRIFFYIVIYLLVLQMLKPVFAKCRTLVYMDSRVKQWYYNVICVPYLLVERCQNVPLPCYNTALYEMPKLMLCTLRELSSSYTEMIGVKLSFHTNGTFLYGKRDFSVLNLITPQHYVLCSLCSLCSLSS